MDPTLDRDYVRDTDEEEDEDVTMVMGGSGRPKLYVVAFKREKGNPLEWRSLYIRTLKALPPNFVVAK